LPYIPGIRGKKELNSSFCLLMAENMRKYLVLGILLVFFSAGSFAAPICGAAPVADCTANPVDAATGLRDCGVCYDSDNDGIFESAYDSLIDFVANGFPDPFDPNQPVTFRHYVRNEQLVPEIGVYTLGIIRQNGAGYALSHYYKSPQIDLAPNQIGYTSVTYAGDDMPRVFGGGGIATSVLVGYNGQERIFINGASPIGFAIPGPNVEITNIVSNIPSPVAIFNVGDNLLINYRVEKQGGGPVTLSVPETAIDFGLPITYFFFRRQCQLINSAGTPVATDTLAVAGDFADLQCSHGIEFLEGQSVMQGKLNIATATGGTTTSVVTKFYEVQGPAYAFSNLAPFSMFQSLGGDMFVDYRIEPEPATGAMRLYFIAETKPEGGATWTERGRWDYFWAAPGNNQQQLPGFDPATMLGTGKNLIRVMAFRNNYPAAVPDPETLNFDPDLFGWAETSFMVPRRVQPDDQPYFPGNNTFTLASGTPLKLGIRNLYDVSAVGGTVTYNLVLTRGNPADITINSLDCSNDPTAICPAIAPGSNWVNMTFVFDQVLPIVTAADLDWDDYDDGGGPGPYGGEAPRLNAQLDLTVNQLNDYEFRFGAINDVPATAVDESAAVEILAATLPGAGIISAVAANDPVNVGQNLSMDVVITEARALTVEIRNAVTNEFVTSWAEAAAISHSVAYAPAAAGNYKATVSIVNPCDACERTIYFSALETPTTSVPETNTLLVLLVALGVVAVVAVKKRRN
jgi:hypothetical protein